MKQTHVLICGMAMVMALISAQAFAQADAVKLTEDPETKQVKVRIGDELFTVYNLSKDWPKPFASPVQGPGGAKLTRPVNEPGMKIDHPHHKGIWIAIDEVNDIKFWAEQGKIENISAEIEKAEGDPAVLKLVNHWVGKEDEPLLEETTTISIFANRLMAYDITFKALEKSVTFEDTKEGLFGIRLIDPLRENETGQVVDSEGRNGSKEAWGQTADWMDYYGQIEGKTFGAAIFDHPDNFRPSRYHVRNYGLFSINPFGEQAYTGEGAKPLTIEPGKTLRLRYGIYIHAGDTETAKVPEVYQDFINHTK